MSQLSKVIRSAGALSIVAALSSTHVANAQGAQTPAAAPPQVIQVPVAPVMELPASGLGGTAGVFVAVTAVMAVGVAAAIAGNSSSSTTSK